MQMQMLRKPKYHSILRSLHALLLLRIVLVTSGRETVAQTRVVLVVKLHPQLRDFGDGVLLQIRCKYRVVLWRVDLHGHGDGIDLLFREKRGVISGDRVDESVV